MSGSRRRSPKSAKKTSRTPRKPAESPSAAAIEVSIGNVAGGALATVLGVDVRSIANFVDEGMPKDSRGEYPLAACVHWYVDRERTTARASKGLNDLDRARLRKVEAEARKSEREAQLLDGEIIRVTEHEEVFGALCDRLRPTIMNISTTYGMALEEAGLTSADAEALLERIAGELMTAMRGCADELDELADDAEREQSEEIEINAEDADRQA